MSPSPPRIAVVGCGAISEVYHLPGLARHPAVLARATLVDPDENRLKKLADDFAVAGCARDYSDVLDRVDGAIVATPHHLHYPIVSAFLARGVPVLCEKPLAATVADARRLVDEADAAGVPLAVNQTRRLFPAYGRIKAILDAGALGRLTALRYSDGKAFRWPTTSGFYFQSAGGAGVLLDKGVHGLDSICWWLGGTPTVLDSLNDAMGGQEAVAHIESRYEDCAISIQFSWLAQLPNCFAIVGDKGRIWGDIEAWTGFNWQLYGEKVRSVRLTAPQKRYNEFGEPMITNFLAVVAGQAEPLVPAAAALPALEWIDDCYQKARCFDLPWLPTAVTGSPAEAVAHA